VATVLLGIASWDLFIAFFAYPVLMWRAGLFRAGTNWREFVLANVTWFLRGVAWPAVLVTWLRQGRPRCPWVTLTQYEGREVRAIVRREILEGHQFR
jgi:hypothetical protein